MWVGASALPAAGRRNAGPPFEALQINTRQIGGIALKACRDSRIERLRTAK
jgi:hypothetical protein